MTHKWTVQKNCQPKFVFIELQNLRAEFIHRFEICCESGNKKKWADKSLSGKYV